MSGRGFESKITTDNDMTFGDSSCVSCGACAHTCPTDAISDVFQSKSAAVDKKVRTTSPSCVGCTQKQTGQTAQSMPNKNTLRDYRHL